MIDRIFALFWLAAGLAFVIYGVFEEDKVAVACGLAGLAHGHVYLLRSELREARQR